MNDKTVFKCPFSPLSKQMTGEECRQQNTTNYEKALFQSEREDRVIIPPKSLKTPYSEGMRGFN
jgi:hypothetical protein